MKEAIKHALQDKIVFWSVILSGVLFIALLVYILIHYSQLPPVLPLYNRMPWGYDRLGNKIQFFIPLITALLFIGINFFVIVNMYARNVFVCRMLGVVSLTIMLCVSIYFLRITQLVL